MKCKLVLLAAGLTTILSGCADFAEGLQAYADQTQAQQGYSYPNESRSKNVGGGDCTAYAQYGRSNNQTYFQVTNTSNRVMHVMVDWSSGTQSAFDLQPGQTSDTIYKTASVTPSGTDTRCDAD